MEELEVLNDLPDPKCLCEPAEPLPKKRKIENDLISPIQAIPRRRYPFTLHSSDTTAQEMVWARGMAEARPPADALWTETRHDAHRRAWMWGLVHAFGHVDGMLDQITEAV